MRGKIMLAQIFWAIVFMFAFALAEIKPERVIMSEDSITIDLADGGLYELTARVEPEGASQALNWYSSNFYLMTVREGVIQAIKTGSGEIRANVPGISAMNAVCKVNIIDSRVPEDIAFTVSALALEPTQSALLTPIVSPATADNSLVWKSSNAGVATVDDAGFVTGKSEGVSYIRAYSARSGDIYGQIAVTVRYKFAPTSITLPTDAIDMNLGETYALKYEITPADASQIVAFRTSDAKVATVDQNGLVTAVGHGECKVYAGSAQNTNIHAALNVRVYDSRVPERIVAYPSPMAIEPSQTLSIDIVMFPQSAEMSLKWKSTQPGVACVDENGAVTAKKEGETIIYAYSAYYDKVFARIPVTVKYGANIRQIALKHAEITLQKGDTAPFEYALSPENASRALVIESSDKSVAYVDENQRVVASKYGETDIVIYSHRNKNVHAVMRVKVEDERFPLKMSLIENSVETYMRAGERFSADFAFEPETASTEFEYLSSNEAIIKIGEDGAPVAVSSGVATVTAQSAYNPDLKVPMRVTVLSMDYALEMPERRTDIDGIEANLEKIDSIRASAQNALKAQFEAGEMPENEYIKRAEVIDAAFEMYGFAWMVEKEQKYWKAENSEEGAKNFKPGVVYYGLPYISGNNSHRTYNLERALKAGRYKPVEGQRYYLLNQAKDAFRGSYVGNDCSSFVALALFGHTSHAGSTVKTGTLYYDSRLRAVQDASTLRAGDLLVRHSIHVLMFLYWADEAHTQAVFIEQGGNEPAINTVSVSVYDLKDYTQNYYRVRRLRSFD